MLRAAAVQMAGRLADIPFNLDHVFALARDAVDAGARAVALPEFFTTPIVYDERLYECVLPPDNPAVERLRDMAVAHGVLIGGSYLELRDGDVYNTYVLAEPSGALHRHDKDLPTMVENAFYVGGADAGLIQTEKTSIGVAMCWETIRSQTVARLAGEVELLMTGSHWWSEPGWPFPRALFAWADRRNAALMHAAPGAFARLVGAPSLHAAHCGVVQGGYLLTPGGRRTGTRTRLMGEAQIVAADGRVLARRRADEGPGIVMADIEVHRRGAPNGSPGGFWIPRLPALFKLMWWHQNMCGAAAYKRAKADGRIKPYDFTKDRDLCKTC
jgi:predicted amidohydrolase